MATLEEIKAADERMNAAKTALLAYVQRRDPQEHDAALHRRLNEHLKHAMDEFLRLVSELTP